MENSRVLIILFYAFIFEPATLGNLLPRGSWSTCNIHRIPKSNLTNFASRTEVVLPISACIFTIEIHAQIISAKNTISVANGIVRSLKHSLRAVVIRLLRLNARLVDCMGSVNAIHD